MVVLPYDHFNFFFLSMVELRLNSWHKHGLMMIMLVELMPLINARVNRCGDANFMDSSAYRYHFLHHPNNIIALINFNIFIMLNSFEVVYIQRCSSFLCYC